MHVLTICELFFVRVVNGLRPTCKTKQPEMNTETSNKTNKQKDNSKILISMVFHWKLMTGLVVACSGGPAVGLQSLPCAGVAHLTQSQCAAEREFPSLCLRLRCRKPGNFFLGRTVYISL